MTPRDRYDLFKKVTEIPEERIRGWGEVENGAVQIRFLDPNAKPIIFVTIEDEGVWLIREDEPFGAVLQSGPIYFDKIEVVELDLAEQYRKNVVNASQEKALDRQYKYDHLHIGYQVVCPDGEVGVVDDIIRKNMGASVIIHFPNGTYKTFSLDQIQMFDPGESDDGQFESLEHYQDCDSKTICNDAHEEALEEAKQIDRRCNVGAIPHAGESIIPMTGGMIHGQGPKETTEFGAVRESNSGRGRFDLLPFEALEAYAIWSELGADKYGDRNWEQGLSVKDCINRLIRHAIKAGNGWTDEDHLAACMWNAAAAITMMQRRPGCNDHPWLDSPKPEKQKKPLSGRYPWKKGCPVLIARNNHVIQLEELENFCIEEGGPILAAFDDLKMAIKARHKEKEADITMDILHCGKKEKNNA